MKELHAKYVLSRAPQIMSTVSLSLVTVSLHKSTFLPIILIISLTFFENFQMIAIVTEFVNIHWLLVLIL